jgi:hypothetical protein
MNPRKNNLKNILGATALSVALTQPATQTALERTTINGPLRLLEVAALSVDKSDLEHESRERDLLSSKGSRALDLMSSPECDPNQNPAIRKAKASDYEVNT